MLKRIFILAFYFILYTSVFGQKRDQVIKDINLPVSRITLEDLKHLPKFEFDLSAAIPFGEGAEFSGTGINVKAILTNNPYGYLVFINPKPGSGAPERGINDIPIDLIDKIEVLDRRLGWQAGAGYTYLPGKKDGMYKYDNLSITTLFGGINYDVCIGGDVELSAGPAYGSFGDGNSEFGYTVSAGGYYYFKKAPSLFRDIHEKKRKQVSIGIGASINYFDLGEAKPIYTANFGARFTF